MAKLYAIVLILCTFWFNVMSQDTLNLVRPADLQADFENDVVLLTWSAPVDTSATPDTIPPGLIGYNVYSGSGLIGFTAHPVVTYTDNNPDPDVAFYRVTAMYDLSFYGYPGDTAESAPSDVAYAITGYSYYLPFSEYFTTGIFETNQWVPETANWRIAGQLGNPAPCAEFFTSPPMTAYSSSLASTWLSGDYIDGTVYVSFSMKRQIVNPTLTEHLYLDIFNGFEWTEVAGFVNDANTDWVDHKIDLPSWAIEAPFKIRFRAEGENTMNIVNWQIDNIIVYRECPAPYDLVLSIPNPMLSCRVLLEWEDPQLPYPNSGWLRWDDGENSDALGLTDGGSFLVATRFTQAHLIPYIDTYLTTIKIFPYAAGGEIVLKVWTGNNASQLVRSQVIQNYTAGQWNEFILNQPFLITGLEELWFGYEITHSAGTYVAGVDAGPANEGYGDLISLDGAVWESMSAAYSLDFNWNLAGYLTNTPSAGNVKTSRSLTNYNIYRQDTLYATTTDRFFWDDITNFPYHVVSYKVSAAYSDCESAYSNIVYNIWCWESVNDQDVASISIYPNPASDYITVSITGDIGQLFITNITGRKIREYTVPKNSSTFGADISGLPKGIYLVNFVTANGESGGGKVVVSSE